MAQAPPKPRPRNGGKDKPWLAYRKESGYLLLEPGWAGVLDDTELAYIQEKLKADDQLSYWWGFRPGQKSRSEAAIRRVAMEGDPEDRRRNRGLARLRTEMPIPGAERRFSDRTKISRGTRAVSRPPEQFALAFP